MEERDSKEVGERILDLATFIRKEDEQELIVLREQTKASRSKTPRQHRSASFQPVAVRRPMAKSPRAPLPDRNLLVDGMSSSLHNSSSSSSGEDEVEDVTMPQSRLRMDEEEERELAQRLRFLDLAKFVREEEERSQYEAREATKRGQSKTPRETKPEPLAAPKRRLVKSPRPIPPCLGDGVRAAHAAAVEEESIYEKQAIEMLKARDRREEEFTVKRLAEKALGRELKGWREVCVTQVVVAKAEGCTVHVVLLEDEDGRTEVKSVTVLPEM